MDRDFVLIEREALYEKICKTLTNYETPETEDEKTTENELYQLLCEIQNCWDDTITAEV